MMWQRACKQSRAGPAALKTVVNEYLRAGLAQRRVAKTAVRFCVEPVSMGVPLPGRSYDDIGALLEDIEGAEHR